jgi:hypothetical protein
MHNTCPGIYYHGTCSQPAVDAMLAGGPLVRVHPGRRGSFAASLGGLSYLTPCFRYAADYAMMTERADWPSEHDIEHSKLSYVFGFGTSSLGTPLLEEDDLGWAVMHASKLIVGVRNCKWTMNVDFADALSADLRICQALMSEACRLVRSPKAAAMLADPNSQWTSAQTTALGRSLAGRLSSEIQHALLTMGISVAISQPVHPVAAWTFDRWSLRGFMDSPSKAQPIEGAWISVPTLSRP